MKISHFPGCCYVMQLWVAHYKTPLSLLRRSYGKDGRNFRPSQHLLVQRMDSSSSPELQAFAIFIVHQVHPLSCSLNAVQVPQTEMIAALFLLVHVLIDCEVKFCFWKLLSDFVKFQCRKVIGSKCTLHMWILLVPCIDFVCPMEVPHLYSWNNRKFDHMRHEIFLNPLDALHHAHAEKNWNLNFCGLLPSSETR